MAEIFWSDEIASLMVNRKKYTASTLNKQLIHFYSKIKLNSGININTENIRQSGIYSDGF